MNGEKAKQVTNGDKRGSFVISEGQLADAADKFSVSVGIRTKGQRDGDEALELKMSNEPTFKL